MGKGVAAAVSWRHSVMTGQPPPQETRAYSWLINHWVSLNKAVKEIPHFCRRGTWPRGGWLKIAIKVGGGLSLWVGIFGEQKTMPFGRGRSMDHNMSGQIITTGYHLKMVV